MMEPNFESWKFKRSRSAPCFFLSSVDSTHAEMKRCFKDLPPGSLIVANEQTAGKGRHYRNWVSPCNKNLYFNLLVPLFEIPLPKAPLLMQISALCIANILRKKGIPEINVKWPNDIWSNKQKLGGIIAEVLRKGNENFISIGVGLNVNVSKEDLSLIDRPTASLFTLTGTELNRLELLEEIVFALESAYEMFRKEGMKPWLTLWQEMDLFTGNSVFIVEGESRISGEILGINEDGSLSLKTNQGIQKVFSGDLEI